MAFPKRSRGRGQFKPGVMNKTEEAYSLELEAQQRLGIIQWFKFEGVKLKLAKLTFYTPDFIVMNREGFIEIHEVKGHWEDDAKVKIKVAAAMHPFKFLGIRKKSKKDGGGWEITEF